MEPLRRLLAHLLWADQLMVEAIAAATAPDLRAVDLANHVLAAEEIWFARVDGRAPAIPVWPSIPLEECRALMAANRAKVQRHLDEITPEEEARAVTYRNSAGAQFTNTVEDILLHVCLHGSYHRGQIAQFLRGQGNVPKPTDYIAFIRGAPTATRSDSRGATP
jgi:uncharacterized damage-inducible protein DinB